VAFSPDGRFAVSHTKPKGILLWDVASGKLLRTLIGQDKMGDDRDNYSLNFSHDARYVLAGCFVHDLQSGRTTQVFEKCSEGLVAAFPGGNYAIYPGDLGPGLQINEFTTGKLVASLMTLGNGEWMTITADNYYVASPAGEKRLTVSTGHVNLPIDAYRSTYNKPKQVIRALTPLVRKRQ
ncbi:MAG TPA: hypothetical protein VFH31_17360, partial [Pyrinomonadaceae bacterium]|nr:hypothetical protein [Pyrinomonadaceae bacterium]